MCDVVYPSMASIQIFAQDVQSRLFDTHRTYVFPLSGGACQQSPTLHLDLIVPSMLAGIVRQDQNVVHVNGSSAGIWSSHRSAILV